MVMEMGLWALELESSRETSWLPRWLKKAERMAYILLSAIYGSEREEQLLQLPSSEAKSSADMYVLWQKTLLKSVFQLLLGLWFKGSHDVQSVSDSLCKALGINASEPLLSSFPGL